jgi:TFIIH basal transcription factor complex TTD-A subunit
MADHCPLIQGVLVECEPAIKSILVHIDSTHHHEFIIEDLDDTHIFVKETMLHLLKQKLEEVR